MKRVMDKRQRACQIWGSSRGKKRIERGPAVAGRGERGQIDRVDLDTWTRRWWWQRLVRGEGDCERVRRTGCRLRCEVRREA
jgi:hypothetical protein